ncbi:flocculation protein FLO11-like isoform X2 [Portunus trituberculatus]|nr:flocculation protein FLO11-like isoform X2 [Portunus trituberculatus]XP_045125428.1 flocculation protein FLO11-like isoform X2 [Portunus trituberculatus]
MTGSPRKGQSGRQLRSGTLLGAEGEEHWHPATTFAFPESPSPKRPGKAEKKKSPNTRKLRRQTMMPTRQAAAAPVPIAAFASPPLSQRRSRRQSMMPVRLQASPGGDKRRAAKTQPTTTATDTAKAKTKRRLEPSEEPPTNKKTRLIPTSKSASQYKIAPSPATSKKHKSTSALPVSRSSRRPPKTEAPVQAKKSPAKKRALSPTHLESSPPKRRAASRSRSESQLKRSKSLPRGQKKAAKVPEKPVIPSPKKTSVSLKATSPAKKTVTPSKKKTSSSSLKSPPPSKSTKKSTASPAAKKAVTPSKKKSSSSSLKSPPASETIPKKRSTASLKTAASPVSKGQKTPKTGLPSSSHSPASQKTSQNVNKLLTKTPSIVVKMMKVSAIKTPPSMKKLNPKQATPASPSPRRPRLTRSAAKSRMVSSRSARHVSLRVEGKSPPSSLASFRKTPASKRAAATAFPADLGASPALPSAHEQLQRIRDAISAKHATPHKPLPPNTSTTTTTATATATPSQDSTADTHTAGNGKCGPKTALDTHCTPTARLPLPMTPKSSRSSGSVSRFSVRLTSSSVESRYLQHTGPATPHSSTPIKGSHTLEVIGARPSLREGARRDAEEEEEEGEVEVDGGRTDTSVEEEGGENSLDETVEEEEEEEDSSAKSGSTSQNRKSYCSLM